MNENEFVDVPGNPAPEQARPFWYTDRDGRRLRMMVAPALARFQKPRGTVIICPGRTEYVEKYFEVARDMQERGFAVAAFDWPGQGLSTRDLDDPLAGYVDDFSTFTAALGHGLSALPEPLPEPYVLLAHSMGGAIGLEALRTSVLEVEAAAFSAPMWGIQLPPLAGFIASIQNALGQGRSVVGRHRNHEDTFEGNNVTHNPVRFGVHMALVAANPALALGSVTWGWIKAALKVTRGFVRPGALQQLAIPVLVASAGEEALVDNESHAVVAAALRNAEHLTIDGARHEILMEMDDKRAQFLTAFDRLLERANI